MTSTTPGEVTRLLLEIGTGNERAADELIPLVYAELRRLARARMAVEQPGQTLQPTALVHEAYLRLVEDENLKWENRAHFFGAAAEAMRRILIDRARRVSALKRGGHLKRASMTDIPDPDVLEPEKLLALDEALSLLEQQDETMSRLVKLRYFAGLTVRETAQALSISERSVNRVWADARAWLGIKMGSVHDIQ